MIIGLIGVVLFCYDVMELMVEYGVVEDFICSYLNK